MSSHKQRAFSHKLWGFFFFCFFSLLAWLLASSITTFNLSSAGSAWRVQNHGLGPESVQDSFRWVKQHCIYSRLPSKMPRCLWISLSSYCSVVSALQMRENCTGPGNKTYKKTHVVICWLLLFVDYCCLLIIVVCWLLLFVGYCCLLFLFVDFMLFIGWHCLGTRVQFARQLFCWN